MLHGVVPGPGTSVHHVDWELGTSQQKITKMADVPIVFVLSGKRKSGKDHVAEKLKEIFGEELCVIMRLSGPLKHEYAREHGLDFNRLLDSTSYKERYRVDMIRWGEDKRAEDPEYFCIKATELALRQCNSSSQSVPHDNEELEGNIDELTGSTRKVWIVSDARRKSDLTYFREKFESTVAIRVVATDEVRQSRGWIFTKGVDDAESECGLDDESFDIIIENNGDEKNLARVLSAIRLRFSSVEN